MKLSVYVPTDVQAMINTTIAQRSTNLAESIAMLEALNPMIKTAIRFKAAMKHIPTGQVLTPAQVMYQQAKGRLIDPPSAWRLVR